MNTKKQIEKCIEYLKSISLKEPGYFRVEEVEEKSIVLSYVEKQIYSWQDERLYKRFRWDIRGNIISMNNFRNL